LVVIASWPVKSRSKVMKKAFDSVLANLYSHTGRPLHPPRVMLKMLLLEQWFNLSDNEMKMQARMRIDFLCFLDLSLVDPVPDATALVRFRQRLLADQFGKMLFDRIFDQLVARNMIVRKGTLIEPRSSSPQYLLPAPRR